MITSFILYIASIGTTLLTSVLGVIDFVLPDEVSDGITYFLSHFNYLRGFFDVDTFFQAFGIFLIFIGYLQIIRVALWVYGMLPWIGKYVPLPRVISEQEAEAMVEARHWARGRTSYRRPKK